MNSETESVLIQNEADAWKKAAIALENIQNQVSIATKTQDLILTLLEADLPLESSSELSIIYQRYGTDSPLFLAYAGKPVNSKSEPDFVANNSYITEIIDHNDEKWNYLSNKEQCEKAGFLGYKSVLIVPMKLNDIKNIGAFVIHSHDKEYAYEGVIPSILDILSDRIAFYIQTHSRIQRHNIFDRVRNELLGGNFPSECKLLDEVASHIQSWHRKDNIYILIKNTMNTDTYYLACDKGKIIDSFREKGVLTEDQVNLIIGGKGVINRLEECNGLIINTPQSELTGIDEECRSWLGATLLHPSGYNLGFIVLHNTVTKMAYEPGEESFIDGIADFTALLLASFRVKQKQKYLQSIVDYKFKNSDGETELYDQAHTFLNKAYGIDSLAIAIVNRNNQVLEPVFNAGGTTIPFDEELLQVTIKHAVQLRTDLDTDANKLTVTHNDQKYLITPMRTGSTEKNWKVIGCFVIPVSKVGNVSARTIDEISDALAVKLNDQIAVDRYQILNEFGKKVGQLSTDGLTKEKIISLAHTYISKAMFTENLFIALYNQPKNEISFPLIQKNGKPWPKKTRPKPRPLDKNQQGKTEAIILTEQPILHLSNKESEEWYTDTEHPERQEFVDDYLASWVGVPIFTSNDQGVAGVIATYHPTVDYVYSQGDVFFLQNVANEVSSLLRALQLAKTNEQLSDSIKNNSELKKAQAEIADREHILSTSLLAQDLTHRLNNSIGAISININTAQSDIKSAVKYEQTNHLEFTLEGLEDSSLMLKELIKEIQKISDDSKQQIALEPLIEKIVQQVKLGKRLDESINIILKIQNNLPKLTVHSRTFFNSIYSIVDNAADALISKSKFFEGTRNEGLFLSIVAQQEKNKILIEIKDNGSLVPEEVKEHIFEYGVSSKKGATGFGLWRSQAVIKTLQGDLTFSENTLDSTKSFTIILPVTDNSFDDSPSSKALVVEKIAYVLDDEKTWRNIIRRWLTEDDFTVEVTNDIESMKMLLAKKTAPPSHIFLDISLDRQDGSNRDGLGLIKDIKKYHPYAKIIIVTGYANLAEPYKDEYDILIEKVSKEGDVITKEKFLDPLHEST